MINSLTSLLDWIDWLGLLLAIILLGVLIILIWQRKHPKATPSTTLPAIPLLAAKRLLKVWRGFIRAIPWRLRAKALTLPVSVVIGEAGSGKTALIDRYANWQGQDFRFHPSAINDPLLQIYQGANAIVLELSAALLYDTQPTTYRALQRLWQHLPTHPQAVIVIDARTLVSPEPEQLRLSGRALIGKLKIVNELEGKPLPLVIALTYMDELAGFAEFCTFLDKTNIPLHIEFSTHNGLTQLTTCLERFQPLMQRALINCTSQDYLKIIAFLAAAPQLFGVLTEFLQVAGLDANANSSPLIRLCLVSTQTPLVGCEPFARPLGFVAPSPFKLDFHAQVALILLLLGTGYLSGSYWYQKTLLTDALASIQTVRDIPIELYPEKISPMFLDFSADLNKHALLTFQPNFFPKIVDYSNHLLIRELRTCYLIPMLKLAQSEPDAMFKTIKLLSILYAKPDNEMGNLVLRQLDEKPTNYMIEQRLLIREYISNNSHTDELDHVLNDINYSLAEIYRRKHQALQSLLQNLDDIFEKQLSTELDLKTLAQQAQEFLKFIDEVNSHKNELLRLNWLETKTGLDINLHAYYAEQVTLRQKPLADLLRLISSHNLASKDATCPSTVSINQCINKMQVLSEVKTTAAPITLSFTVDGRRFAYTNSQWENLIKDQFVATLLRNTIASHKYYDGWAFFDAPSIYPDVEMNSTNKGEALFTGKMRIDGRLTAEAFEKDVRPAVLALTTIIAKLPVTENEKKYFTRFVLDHLRVYTNMYIDGYANYARQFQVRITSAWALNYVLDQIQQPNAPLLQTLVQIKNNTALKLTDSPYFQPFSQRLALFNFVQHVMQEKDGVYPELQKYQAIMAQLQTELNSHEPYLPKKSDGDAAALKGAITPLGRVAWGMLVNEDGTYTTLVKSWLQNAGIPNHLQQPFLAPVQKVAELGAAEIKQTINGIWADIWDSNVTPLLDKFPFAPTAERDKELTAEELTKIFHPKQGAFWSTVQQYLAPLCKFNNGVWVKRQELSGSSLALATSTLERLNAAQQLTSSLWDAQGNPKPLQIAVKPGLLPVFDAARLPNAPLVALTYLRNGGVSTLGFNQQQTWQKFPLEWWLPQLAEVGMEFRKDGNPTQAYVSTTVTDSQWNFFRLIQQSKSAGNHHYQWSLAHPEFPQQPLNLGFAFKAAPWAVFSNLAGS
jgi:hypothetical protein